MNREPYIEPMFIVHIDEWRYVIREDANADGCCAVHYEENIKKDGKNEVRKFDPVGLGEPASARAVAKAILKWCDQQEKLQEEGQL